jgi:hypothetical protein
MDTLLAGLRHLPLKFTRNKLTIHIDAADPTLLVRSGMLTHAEISCPVAYQSANYAKVGERIGSEKPVAQLAGLPYFYGTDFDIETILDGKVSYCPPSRKNNTIQLCPNLTIPFKIRSYIEKNGIQIANTDAITNSQFCLKAGLSADDYAGWKDNYFTTYLDEHLPFLTNQQNDKEVSRNQTEYLYFLVNFLPKPTALKLRVKVYFNDGTDVVYTLKTLNSVQQYSVYSIPVGFTDLGLESYENIIKKVVSWDIWVNNNTDNRVSEIRSYIVDEHFARNERQIIFSNSLGGYDTLRVTGVASDTLKVTKQTGERELESNYLPSASDMFVNGVEGRPEMSVNTGFLDADQISYLQEILLSEDIYILTKDGFVPIILTDESLLKNQDNVDIDSRTFTFTYGKKEMAYSVLPIAPTAVTRELRWSPSGSYCVYNPDTGLANGFQGATTLTLVYADTNEIVRGVPPKDNTPGTDGYYEPQLSSFCSDGYAPFKNVLISRLGTFRRNDCVSSYGDFATVVIMANILGGLTQFEADTRAEELWDLINSQDYANTHAGCIASPEFYTINPVPPINSFNFRYAFGSGVSGVIYIHGGPGASGGNADLVYGNHWAVQTNTNPGSIKIPTGQNDCFLPNVIPGGYRYYITFAGYNQNRRMRLYVNGVLKEDITITAAQFQANGGGHIYQLQASTVIPSQATNYCILENV